MGQKIHDSKNDDGANRYVDQGAAITETHEAAGLGITAKQAK
jgi:hypothetical protein